MFYNNLKRVVLLVITVAFYINLETTYAKPFALNCSNPLHAQYSDCVNLKTIDIMRSVKFLDSPPVTSCKYEKVVQGLAVCTDNLPKDCNMLTIATTDDCGDIGQLTFEKYWSL